MIGWNCMNGARQFFKDKRGLAAMEFALIAPVLILLYLGSVEVTGGIDVDKKLSRAASMMSDLVTQEQTKITKNLVSNIMNVGAATLLPYWRDTPQITVTAINVSSAGTATVAWSRRRVNGVETRPFIAGSGTDLDANLRIAGTSVIRVEMSTAYVPLLAWTMKNPVSKSNGTSAIGIALADRAFGRVRQGPALACNDC